MPKQLRKFEQDAIVNTIVNKLQEKEKTKIKKLVSKKDYRLIDKQIKNLQKLKQQEQKLSKQISNSQNELRNKVETFNEVHNLEVSPLEYSYHYKSIEFGSRRYSVIQSVENKLAIALISEDWQNKLPEIINAIVKDCS